jgi:poly(hydroxyalkanoate) depolymerase family esterase
MKNNRDILKLKWRLFMQIKFVRALVLFCLIQFGFSVSAETKFVFYEPKSTVNGLAPLFVVLHGFSSSAQDIAAISRFSEWADREGFYILYPESEEPNIWMKCWQYFLPDEQIRGQGAANEIIHEIKKLKTKYPIDADRIFIAGMSAGASLASILVSCYPKEFAGVSFHSGTSYGLSSTWKEALIDLKAGPSSVRSANDACDPKDFQGKIMLFQGTKDDLVNMKHIERYEADFLAGMQVDTKRISEDTVRFAYNQKDFFKGSALFGRGIIVDGMIHTWSGGTADGKDKDNQPTKIGPDATELTVNFFLHQK